MAGRRSVPVMLTLVAALAVVPIAACTGDDAATDTSAALADVMDEVASGSTPLRSLLVRRSGEVVAESYAPGVDPDEPYNVHSVTKSVVAVLVGIAVDEGLLALDTQVVEVLGDVASDHPDLTVEHLLSMTAGIDITDADGGVDLVYASADPWVATILRRPASGPPGEGFEYCSACTHLLTAMLDEVTADDLGLWAHERLSGPLGEDGVLWLPAPDGTDVLVGGWGILLTTQQLGVLGQLALDEGGWDGQQLVSRQWMRAATTEQIDLPEPFEPEITGYGYLWWIAADDAFAALGRFGQVVLVVPELDLVVAATAELPDEQADAAAVFVWDRVVEVVR